MLHATFSFRKCCMQLFRFENVACNFFVCLGLLALLDVSRNRETWRRVWRVCMCGGARGRGRGGERWALQRKDRGREKWSWHSWVQGQRARGCVARGGASPRLSKKRFESQKTCRHAFPFARSPRPNPRLGKFGLKRIAFDRGRPSNCPDRECIGIFPMIGECCDFLVLFGFVRRASWCKDSASLSPPGRGSK